MWGGRIGLRSHPRKNAPRAFKRGGGVKQSPPISLKQLSLSEILVVQWCVEGGGGDGGGDSGGEGEWRNRCINNYGRDSFLFFRWGARG